MNQDKNNFNTQENNMNSYNELKNNQNINYQSNSQSYSQSNFQPNTNQNLQPQSDPSFQQVIAQKPTLQSTKSKNNKSKIIFIIAIVLVVFTIFIILNAGKLMKNNNANIINNTNNSESTTEDIDGNSDLTYDKNGEFLMYIEDVFNISGRGTMITGKIESGTIKINDKIKIKGSNHKTITTTVIGIELFRKTGEYGEAGDNVGLVLKDISTEDVGKDQVVTKTN